MYTSITACLIEPEVAAADRVLEERVAREDELLAGAVGHDEADHVVGVAGRRDRLDLEAARRCSGPVTTGSPSSPSCATWSPWECVRSTWVGVRPCSRAKACNGSSGPPESTKTAVPPGSSPTM